MNVSGSTLDITEKKPRVAYAENNRPHHTTPSKEEQESRYILATEGSGIAIWDWNTIDNTLYLSKAYYDMLGIQDDHADKLFTISYLKNRIHPEDRDDLISVLNAHLERGFLFSAECRLLQDDGHYRHVSISGQAQWDAQRHPQRIAGSIIDISDRYRAINQLTSSNNALQRFAYICSHDLKEPARIVDSFSHLLQKQYADTLDNRAKEYLDHIRLSAGRMQDMIQSILDYSQADHKPLVRQKVNCYAEVEKALENLALSIEEAEADIIIGSLPHIDADRTQIFQLFLNLIGNALKFRGEKTPVITINAKETASSWLFSIKDNGIGIEQHHADNIFSVFRRLHDTSEYKGTGIGLSICYRVVEKHRGNIWVESSPGNGATFYFTIPTNHKIKTAL